MQHATGSESDVVFADGVRVVGALEDAHSGMVVRPRATDLSDNCGVAGLGARSRRVAARAQTTQDERVNAHVGEREIGQREERGADSEHSTTLTRRRCR